MARQLARKLGMHPDDNEPGDETSDGDDHDDDDKKWFYKSMDYVDFKESLRGMETEEEQETLRREAREHQLEDDTEIETESNSDSFCDPVDDEEAGDIRQIVNPLLDSSHTDKEAEKKSATLLVPGVGRRYKSTVIAELRNKLSKFLNCLQTVLGGYVVQVHHWKVRRPVTVVPQTAMVLLVCLTTVCFTTLLAPVNSSWAEYKGCAKKEPKDLSSMFAPLTLVTNQRMSRLLYLNTVALLKTAIFITTRKLLWQCH